jgi:DNA-binding NtrC family response regulator
VIVSPAAQIRRILIIDDEESLRYTCAAFLEGAGHRVWSAASREEAGQLLDDSDEPFDLVFLDICLGSDNGLEFLGQLRLRFPLTPIVMITGAPDVATAADALRQGAFDYIPKPLRQETLLHVARQALHHRALVEERELYRNHLEAIFRSVGEGIVLIDRSLTILEANAAAMLLLDLPCEARGVPLAQLAESARAALRDLVGRTLQGERAIGNVRCELNNGKGSRVLALAAATWAGEGGNPRGVVVTVRDETRLESLERGLKKRRNFEHIIGQSQNMQEVYGLIENLAEVDTTVLITGESGTGKELVADALHCRSPRRSGPLIKVNCAALPENLLESELFGHLKGSFTGAIKDKAGRFQLAHRGTIFLDEIGDITPALQVRLLRVLQNKEVERVGSSQPIPVDVRIVAATNSNLAEKVRRGEFREDLYYRLRVVEIELPPLRERREDIPLLVNHFVAEFNERFGRRISGVASEALMVLSAAPWPGNIRELRHAIEHAFVICRDSEIALRHLPRELQTEALPTQPLLAGEAARIMAALEKAAGNKARAARLLGISRRTIYRKIEEYGIIPPPEPC